MKLFPKIQSPCPVKADIAAYMDGDQCRLCRRQVVDITAFSPGETAAFFAGCETEVCVSYRLPKAAIGAALALAAAAAPMAAAAQDAGAAPAAVSADASDDGSAVDATEVDVIVMGGIKDPSQVGYVDADGQDVAAPELPVTYEDEAPAAASVAPAARPGGA